MDINHPAHAPSEPVQGASTGRKTLPPLSLRQNFSWVFLGNAVCAGGRWGLIVFLARLGGPEMVGQVALALAIGAQVGSLADLGLRNALVSDVKGQYRFGDYLGLRLAAALASLLVMAGIALVRCHEAEVALLIFLVGAGTALELVNDIFFGLLQRYERMDRIGIALVIKWPLILTVMVLGVLLTGSPVWGMLGYPAAMAAVLFLYVLPSAARVAATAGSPLRLFPRCSPGTLLSLAWVTLPMGLALMVSGLSAALPRYLISFYRGNEDLGVFAAVASLGTLLTTVVGALGQSFVPRLAKHYAAADSRAFTRLLGKLSGLTACLGLAMVLAVGLGGRPLLRSLYGDRFSQQVDVAVCLVAAAALSQLSFSLARAMFAMRRFWWEMAIRTAGVVLLAGLLPGMIAAWGLHGAAWAMCASAALVSAAYVAATLHACRHVEKARAAESAEEVSALSAMAHG